jgi:hypothetical protein|tara:strand:- start:614 stop:832 length:219 start_codon:yes stop_codon:yes gene_type:complete
MSDYESDFKLAVENDMTCSDCKHNQLNKLVKNVRIDAICMNEDNEQTALHGNQPMDIKFDFLCNKFELFDEV